MSYLKNIIQKLSDNEQWPHFEKGDFLDDLNELADKSFANNSTEGYLSALLIYHQICEEMIKLLIESSTFLIQLSIFPQQYKNRHLKDKMFGQLINELNYSIIDNETILFISKCQELNKIRINMVHKITLTNSINEISIQSQKAQNIFNEIFSLFETINDNYRASFSYYKKNIDELSELLD